MARTSPVAPYLPRRAQSRRDERVTRGPFDASRFATSDEAIELLGDVIESSTQYTIVATDPDGDILLWNEGARRLYGYEPDEIVGRSWSVLHTDEDVRNRLPAR